MANPVVHFEILGRDLFYGDLFGWELNVLDQMNYALVEAGERGIGGGIGKTDEGAGHVTFYIEVDDPQAYLDRAERLGGTTIMPVTVIPDMVTFALVADPEGHVVGVVKAESPEL